MLANVYYTKQSPCTVFDQSHLGFGSSLLQPCATAVLDSRCLSVSQHVVRQSPCQQTMSMELGCCFMPVHIAFQSTLFLESRCWMVAGRRNAVILHHHSNLLSLGGFCVLSQGSPYDFEEVMTENPYICLLKKVRGMR